MQSLWQDVRYGVRQLASQRAFTSVAVLTLALGIGANVAIFSTAYALFLKSLPIDRPGEIVQVLSNSDGGTTFSHPLWEQLRNRQDFFSGMLAWSDGTFNLAQGGEVRNANALWASGGYFSTLGVRPYRGRLLAPEDDRRGGAPMVAVLGYALWQKEYAGRDDVIGNQIRLDGHLFQIVGVTPPQFFGMNVGVRFDVAVPLAAEPVVRGENSSMDEPGARWLQVAARLRPGISLEQADARLAAISAASFEATASGYSSPEYLAQVFRAAPAGNGVSALRLRYQQAVWVLMGVVSLVLLIACANLANLLLARAVQRRKEMGVRLTLGASRRRLIQQLLTESLLIAAMGTALAVPLATTASRMLVQQIATSESAVFLDLAPDWRVAAFVASMALLTTVFFGLAPAFNATRVSLTEAMTGSGPGAAERRGRFSLSRVLVVAQVAISMVLVAGAGLLLRTFYNLTSLDVGFDANRVLLVALDLSQTQASAEGRAVLYEQLLEHVRAIPGVTAASQSNITPISGHHWTLPVDVPGYVPNERFDAVARYQSIAPQYFAAMGAGLIAGRDFTAQDSANAPKVAIVTEAFARKFFQGRSPLGQQYVQRDGRGGRYQVEIVGMVKDAKYIRIREVTRPIAYIPQAQREAETHSNLIVRGAAAPATLIPAVRAAIEQVSPQTSMEFRTLARQVGDSLLQDRLLAMLSGVFGGLALALSAVGLYGLLAHSVAWRRREIGIRMALGSTPARILRLILGDGLRLALAGVALGTLGAIAATRVLATFLFGVEARDPLTLTTSGILLVGIAMAACSGTARRAARIEPYSAIRQE